MSCEVRAAAPADLDAVIALLVAQLREHAIDTATASIAAAADGIVRHPERGCILVACEAGAIVGVAALSFVWTIEHGGRSAWLEELYVSPPARGRGIGTALLRAALRTAADAGAAAVDLEVDAGHRRAARLYAREGFHALGRERWVRALR